MLAFSSNFNSRDKLNKMKVEEQMVPCGGVSPPPQTSESNFVNNNNNSNYSMGTTTFGDSATYGNLADTFDLSLLGDFYDDHDMATVPSPMMSGLEASWQQTSFYAPSPSDVRAFSPDCKPFQSISDQMSPAVSNNQTLSNESLMCRNNGISTLSLSNDVGSSERNALLRQCLADTTFQVKHNFKPMELPTITVNDDLDAIMKSNSGGLQSGNGSMEINPIDPVFSLAYEQMRSDVQNTCRTLSISPDPAQWSAADLQSWLVHSLRSMDSSSVATSDSSVCAALRNFWNMDGRSLCSLSEDEFRSRDAVNGDKLFASLELWKMLQWSGLGQQMMSPPHELDISYIVGGGPLSGASSPASVCPDLLDDIKLFSDKYIPDPVLQSKFYSPSPSSVGTCSKNSDDDESEEEEEKPCEKAKRVRPQGSKGGAHIHLWQFLKELLESGQQHGPCIRWLDQSRGVFKIEDSVRVARLWGLRKNRPAMNYDKLSRSIRQYYRKGIMRKTERSQRLVYQFCHPYGC